jgi:hypothetical protein
MRYVIVDLEGASRDYFGERQELIEALEELGGEEPGTTAEVFIVTYDERGDRVGEPERGDEVLDSHSGAKNYRFDQATLAAWSRSAYRLTKWPEHAAAAGRSRAAVSA